MTPVQFSRAVLHAKYELERFLASLDHLSAHDFPSESIRSHIQQLRDHLGASDLALVSIESDFEDDPDGASDRIVSEYRKITSYRHELEVLAGARSDEVPWSLVPSIEKLAQKLNPGKRILITTTPAMTYMVRWSRSKLHPFVTIFLPRLHRANAFLHILISHELFHPIVDDFIGKEQAKVAIGIRDECKRLFGAQHLPLLDQHRLDQIVQLALTTWDQGIKELMCDMGAASVFGPAALWSVSAFACTTDQDQEPSPQTEFYPPWRLRLKTMVTYLNDKEDCQNRLARLEDLLKKAHLPNHASVASSCFREEQSSANVPIHFSNPITQIAYDFVVRSLPDAMNAVQSLGVRVADRWTETLDQVPKLLERLELLVPPSEIIEAGNKHSLPASLSAIFLASWVERLTAEQTGIDLERYRLICRLSLKAIEDADIEAQFIAWKAASA